MSRSLFFFVIIDGKISFRSSKMDGFSIKYISLNLSKNALLVCYFFQIFNLMSRVMEGMKLVLLLILIEVWKNLVFLSPSLIHNFLDFCFSIESYLWSCSSSREKMYFSVLTLCDAFGYACKKVSLFSRFLILPKTYPKCCLFQLLNSLANAPNLAYKKTVMTYARTKRY